MCLERRQRDLIDVIAAVMAVLYAVEWSTFCQPMTGSEQWRTTTRSSQQLQLQQSPFRRSGSRRRCADATPLGSTAARRSLHADRCSGSWASRFAARVQRIRNAGAASAEQTGAVGASAGGPPVWSDRVRRFDSACIGLLVDRYPKTGRPTDRRLSDGRRRPSSRCSVRYITPTTSTRARSSALPDHPKLYCPKDEPSGLHTISPDVRRAQARRICLLAVGR